VTELRGETTLEVPTPEGTILAFAQASVYDRIVALLVDQLILLFASLLLFLAGVWVAQGAVQEHFIALFIFLHFSLRMAYFPLFEMGPHGATPGKRLMRIRVLSRDGGSLHAEQVLVRNLTREFEVMLPLVVLLSPGSLHPNLPMWASLLCSLWLLVGALFPFVDRRRLRLGDLLGGTTVVVMPRAELLDDLARVNLREALAAEPEPAFRFSSVQLDQYGIEQLHVLEGLLRDQSSADREATLLLVLRNVERKIGWAEDTPETSAREFLLEFYRQLRAHLEQRALFGDRRAHKREGWLRRTPRQKRE